MFSEIRTLKNLICLAVLAVCPLFAGCGGGGGDGPAPSNDDDSSGPGLVTCIILILATGENVCEESSNSSPTSLSQASSPLAPSSALLLQQNEEFEPNGDLVNANLPSYPVRTSPDEAIGWYVTGSVNDVTDIADAFAFTPSQTRKYVLTLCPPGSSACNGDTGIDTLTAFFRVLDQDGKVLLTSEADSDKGNEQRMTLDAGVLYYLTVDAGDTMGVTVDYRLFAHEAS
jgi:hypothetical protein